MEQQEGRLQCMQLSRHRCSYGCSGAHSLLYLTLVAYSPKS